MNNFRFFDIHSHLSFPEFNDDREEVIKKALDEGGGMIIVGVSAEDSERVIKLASKYDRGVYASAGSHPDSKGEFDYDYFLKLIKNGKSEKGEKVVAIGECGLDYFHGKGKEARQKQKEIFIKHIELALELDKPMMIHCREAHKEMLEILSAYASPKLRGNIHFFTGSWEQAQKYFDLGFLISFTGVITFPPQKNINKNCEQTVNKNIQPAALNQLVKKAPLDKIMAETDAPFVAPVPYRGKRNEPLYVKEVIKKIAEIKNISYEEVAKATTENAKRLFLRV